MVKCIAFTHGIILVLIFMGAQGSDNCEAEADVSGLLQSKLNISTVIEGERKTEVSDEEREQDEEREEDVSREQDEEREEEEEREEDMSREQDEERQEDVSREQDEEREEDDEREKRPFKWKMPSMPKLPKAPKMPTVKVPKAPKMPTVPPKPDRHDGTIRLAYDDTLCLGSGWPIRVERCGKGNKPEFGWYWSPTDGTIRLAKDPRFCFNRYEGTDYYTDPDKIGSYKCTAKEDEKWQVRQWEGPKGTTRVKIEPYGGKKGWSAMCLVARRIDRPGFDTQVRWCDVGDWFKTFTWYPYIDEKNWYKIR